MANSISRIGLFDIYATPVTSVDEHHSRKKRPLAAPNSSTQTLPPENAPLAGNDTVDLTPAAEARLLQFQDENPDDIPARTGIFSDAADGYLGIFAARRKASQPGSPHTAGAMAQSYPPVRPKPQT